MFHAEGTVRRNRINSSLGITWRVSHIGVFIPKPIAATIKLIPSKYKAQYSKRPTIKRDPQISSVYEVNHDAATIKNLGIPLFSKFI